MKHKLSRVEIDDHVKALLLEGVRKAGDRQKLAQILGYSTPSNIIYQFLTAPRLKRTIPDFRFERLKDFIARK